MILQMLMKGENHSISEGEFGEIAAQTACFSGADLKKLKEFAVMEPIREMKGDVIRKV